MKSNTLIRTAHKTILDNHLIDDVSILFARSDSIYYSLCSDVYDINRDARKYSGQNPIVAHPPCRAWGRLRHMAKPRIDERELALFALAKIRQVGGILEHPRSSLLWNEISIGPNGTDQFGGFLMSLNQSWFGHRAEKNTIVYICGCKLIDIPALPLNFDAITHTIGYSRSKRRKVAFSAKKEVTKKEREATPILFAKWLIEVAHKCKSI